MTNKLDYEELGQPGRCDTSSPRNAPSPGPTVKLDLGTFIYNPLLKRLF